MDIKTDTTENGNLVVYFKENFVNPISKETQLIEVTCKISKDQLESLSRFTSLSRFNVGNVDVAAHVSEALKLESKKIKGKNIYEALLKKANKQINFYDIEKVLRADKRYFIIGTLEDIISFMVNNSVFINNNDNDILKNPMGIFGSIEIGNTKIDILYLSENVENSCLLLSTVKDYNNTYKITF